MLVKIDKTYRLFLPHRLFSRRQKENPYGFSCGPYQRSLPTAQVEAQIDDGAIIRAEAYGDGIDMWLRGQVEKVEVLR